MPSLGNLIGRLWNRNGRTPRIVEESPVEFVKGIDASKPDETIDDIKDPWLEKLYENSSTKSDKLTHTYHVISQVVSSTEDEQSQQDLYARALKCIVYHHLQDAEDPALKPPIAAEIIATLITNYGLLEHYDLKVDKKGKFDHDIFGPIDWAVKELFNGGEDNIMIRAALEGLIDGNYLGVKHAKSEGRDTLVVNSNIRPHLSALKATPGYIGKLLKDYGFSVNLEPITTSQQP